MRKAMAVAGICLAACLVFAATEKIQPLNAKTGLWQTTQTVKLTGLPPEVAAGVNPTMTYQSCFKPEDLSTSERVKEKAGLKCSSWNVLKSTASDIEAQASGCDMGHGLMAAGHGNIHLADSEHMTGSIDYTMTGLEQPVQDHASYTSKWIGTTCPADTN